MNRSTSVPSAVCVVKKSEYWALQFALLEQNITVALTRFWKNTMSRDFFAILGYKILEITGIHESYEDYLEF